MTLSLREKLAATLQKSGVVACCAPIGVQHATNASQFDFSVADARNNDATDLNSHRKSAVAPSATTMQRDTEKLLHEGVEKPAPVQHVAHHATVAQQQALDRRLIDGIRKAMAPQATPADGRLADRSAVQLQPITDTAESMLTTACINCRHVSRYGNYGEPVRAGLTGRLELAKHPSGGTDCEAFVPKPDPAAAALRARAMALHPVFYDTADLGLLLTLIERNDELSGLDRLISDAEAVFKRSLSTSARWVSK